MRWIQRAVIAIALAIPVGFVGAWAFNPGSGAVLHSYLLWHVFGGMAELGVPLLLAVIMAGAILSVVRRLGPKKPS